MKETYTISYTTPKDVAVKLPSSSFAFLFVGQSQHGSLALSETESLSLHDIPSQSMLTRPGAEIGSNVMEGGKGGNSLSFVGVGSVVSGL